MMTKRADNSCNEEKGKGRQQSTWWPQLGKSPTTTNIRKKGQGPLRLRSRHQEGH
jgi:hypothetical protein